MKKIFFLFFVFLLPYSATSQWFLYNNDTTLTNVYFNSVHFIDTLNGWIAGDNGLIIHTTDSGVNWIRQTSGFLGHLRKIRFSDLLHGWVVGDSGKILRTTNGGETWVSQNSSGNWTLHILSVIDSLTAYVIAKNEQILLQTTDAGITWNNLNLQVPANHYINTFCFIDNSNGWFCCTRLSSFSNPPSGQIFSTTNGGISWFNQFVDNNHLFRMFFLDQNFGWCSGEYYLYTTTNGGSSWIQRNLARSYNDQIYFVDPNIGWTVYWGYGAGYPSDSHIYFSSDGGFSWVFQFSSLGKLVTDLCFIEKKHGWAVGQSGLILHTTNGGGALTSTENEIPDLVSSFSLSQNYPNPFNPSTKIRYAIPASPNPSEGGALVKLKVYDVLGNEVATLVYEYKPEGSYEVEFDGTNLTSGIYFYQLNTGNFIETKKMILLR